MEDMTTDQFNRLWQYMHAEFRAIRERFSDIDQKFDAMNTRFDKIEAVLHTDELEIGAIGMQLDRHEARLAQLENTSS